MRRSAATLGLVLAAATSAHAIVPPASPVAEKAYRHPDLHIPPSLRALSALPAARAATLERDAIALGASRDFAFFDTRAERIASLILSQPFIPGDGDGNTLAWPDGRRPGTDAALEEMVWERVLAYLDRHAAILRVSADEIGAPRVGVFEHGDLIQAYAQRHVGGIPVRSSGVTAIVSHGNLVLLGLESWADARPAPDAKVNDAQARAVIARHVAPHVVEGYGREAALEYVPLARGDGLDLRLVRVVKATVRGDVGSWEGLVDAATGELIAFEDTNQYAGRNVIGGVYPLANDQRTPDGLEQPAWPMPFVNVSTPDGPRTTNSAGGLGCVEGTVATALVGRYARITDLCGVTDESSAASDLDLGFGPTPTVSDCAAVPPGHSAGDTKSARSAYYAATRINEQARAYLPGNDWLQTTLLTTVNSTSSCGAHWNGTSIRLYRSSAQCGNEGENPGIFFHEWGHGLDDNNVNPNISSPGEAFADIHGFLQTDTSCIGRGFFRNLVCGGYGDPCLPPVATGCTGVRDIDFAKHACGQPHTIQWVLGGFPAAMCADNLPHPACPSGGGTPCGRETHCEGQIAAEAGWDLARRDLPASGLDVRTSLQLSTRLFYLAGETLTTWYECTPGGSCAATNAYMLTLAADDDDGNLANGTPHMTAIRAAYERHQIHCATPAPVDSGCAGGPTAAPTLTAVVQGPRVTLTWTAVAGAARYDVFRSEGVSGDTFGRVKIAEVTGTSFVEGDLLSGHPYHFAVLPVGANTSCFGRMSNPVSVTPTPGAAAAVLEGHTLSIAGGDGDDFLDNCEVATVGFTVENSGNTPLTNVRLVGVGFLTHPASVLHTTLPAPIAPALAECGHGAGSIAFVPVGLTPFGETQVRVDVTADELAGQVVSRVFTLRHTEVDAALRSTRTWDFDVDLQGWVVLPLSTYTRQPGGAQGTPFHVSSSENLADRCDAIRSPLLRLKANSTLSIHDRFQIEPSDPTAGPYDRANVGLRDVETGGRTVITPSGGQLYTTNGTGTGMFIACELAGQPGWNGNSPGFPNFNASLWNAAALNPGGAFTDRLASLEIRYGTDPLLHPSGLDFDQVTVTDFDELVADLQNDACVAQAVLPLGLAVDTGGNSVYQPNETVVVAPTWRNTGTQALALTGAFTNHTGPAGPTYTIPDAAASYGTIAVGGNQSCTSTNNCYSVANSVSTRPATHWDTTVVETVTPTSTAKTWTLHIGNSFAEVPPTSPFLRFIEILLHRGVTGGCSQTNYCPSSSTTREQMAVFVILSKEPPGYIPPVCVAGSEAFGDVPASSPFCRWIEELARRGVVSGCGGGNYCPSNPVSREQMAIFVLKTLDPALVPPACVAPNLYLDVPETSPFCRYIEELTTRGVVSGCGGGNYCPASAVTREQMGVFLAVTFGLSLYGL